MDYLLILGLGVMAILAAYARAECKRAQARAERYQIARKEYVAQLRLIATEYRQSGLGEWAELLDMVADMNMNTK